MRTPEDAPTDPDRLIRLGTVASVDLAAATCTVTLDDGVVTGQLKWKERRSGDTKTWSPPSVGEQVELRCPGGEIGAGVVDGAISSTANPPAGNSLTELITFKDSAIISYDPIGHVLTATLPASATCILTAPGGLTINGEVMINGSLEVSDNVLVDNGASGTFTSLDGLTVTVQDGIVTNIY